MEFGHMGKGLRLIGDIALLIGLVLVGYQIKQSNDIAYASLASLAYQQETDRFVAEMGESPAATLAKAYLDPQSLTPEEVWVVSADVQWRLSMFRRNAQLEELGIFSNRWRTTYLPVSAREIGRNVVMRNFLLRHTSDEDWLKEMQEIALAQPADSLDFLALLKNPGLAR